MMDFVRLCRTMGGDEPVKFTHNGVSYVVRTRVQGRANTIFEYEADGARRFFKVPLKDPYDIPASFGEAEVLASRLELGDVQAQELIAGSPG